MATRAPRPCKKPACPHLSRDGSGWCKEHYTEPESGWWRTSKGSRQARGYGAQWDRLRARVLARDKRLCLSCKELGIATPATEVDHIIPKSQGGTDSITNLQSICKDCHKVKTQRESKESRYNTKRG